MLTHDDLGKIREQNEVEDTWRKYSRHIVADMLEGCAICGTIREREHLVRCRWCEDVYICKQGVCSQQHQAEMHPAVAFWTW
jgi:hypothetical protein